MSVPLYKRHLSPMEFISNATELEAYTSAMCSKFQGRRHYYGVIQIYQLASDVTELLITANNYNLTTFYNERTNCFTLAKSKLDALSNKLDILKLYKNSIQDYQWFKWGNLINKELMLISKIMKSDRDRIVGA